MVCQARPHRQGLLYFPRNAGQDAAAAEPLHLPDSPRGLHAEQSRGNRVVAFRGNGREEDTPRCNGIQRHHGQLREAAERKVEGV